MLNCINFIFNVLYIFLAVSIIFVLPIGFLIIWEKWQEINEPELDDTSKIFRYDLRKLKGKNE